MNKYTHFFGIDVSKNHLDICLIHQNKTLINQRIENSKKAIKLWVKEVINQHDIDLLKSIFCMENTGHYTNHCLYTLSSLKTNVWMEMPIQIIKSQGFTRGKTDKVDAFRIAEYAMRFQSKFKAWNKPSQNMQMLKTLSQLRDKLIQNINQYASPKADIGFVQDKEIRKVMKQTYSKIIKELRKQVKDIDQKIKTLINKDTELNRLYQIIISVTGMGAVTTVNILVCTHGFQKISSPKEFACYGGVAPFEVSSGKQIYKQRKVSHMANKNTKRLLHMAAMSAIQVPGELREYYLRKTENGKPKLIALNAVRNKLIHRVFACVKRNELYKR